MMASRLALRWWIVLGVFLFAVGLALYDGWVVRQMRVRPVDAPQSADKDEQIYGKGAWGPKTPTPLDQAVAQLNKQLEERCSANRRGSELSAEDERLLRPVTAEEVIEVVRDWARTVHPIGRPTSDEELRLLEQIAADGVLPPHAQLAVYDLPKKQHQFLQIVLDMMVEKDFGRLYIIRRGELGQLP